MTQRSEFQQRALETKSQMMNWVANRLFSTKQDGVDGFLKRQVLKTPKDTKENSK